MGLVHTAHNLSDCTSLHSYSMVRVLGASHPDSVMLGGGGSIVVLICILMND